jgi:hypothetical protein
MCGVSEVELSASYGFTKRDGYCSPVLWDIQGIRKRVLLRLQTNLDDLHWRDDEHGFRRTGEQTGEEDALGLELALFV